MSNKYGLGKGLGHLETYEECLEQLKIIRIAWEMSRDRAVYDVMQMEKEIELNGYEAYNPIEEAHLLDSLYVYYGLKIEVIAANLYKNITYVSDSIRLLRLDRDIKNMVVEGKLSREHAVALLDIPIDKMQKSIAERVINEHLSVSETEMIVNDILTRIEMLKSKRRKNYRR